MSLLDKLQSIAEAATPGPWRTGRLESYLGDGTPVSYVYRLAGDDIEETHLNRIQVLGSEGKMDCDADAKHIAAFNPKLITAMIAAYRAACEHIDGYREKLAEQDSWPDCLPDSDKEQAFDTARKALDELLGEMK